MTWPKSIPFLLAALASAGAADIKVYSEFRRVGPDAEIVPADRGGAVREILSPRAIRGGFASFQLVVEGEPGTEFWIYIGQNPDEAGTFKLYRAAFTAGVPDRLEAVDEPVRGEIAAGHKAAVFWLDVKYPASGPAGRVKLEPQLFLPAEKRWVIYPMEVNIMPARTRVVIERVATRQAAGNADAQALAVVRAFRCGGAIPEPASAPGSVPGMIERNARQDVSLMRRLSPALLKELLPDTFCTADFPREGMLRVRDRLYKLLEKEQ